MDKLAQKIKKFNPNKTYQYYKNYALATQTLIGAGTIQLIKECAEELSINDVYLEVGCYQAWNFSLVCHFARCECVAVDNFSQQFQEDDRYDLPTRDLVIQNIQTIGRRNGKLVEGDFRETLDKNLESLKGRVKIYFYDGPHEEKDQIDGIEKALHLLADDALIFVDDWASENVKSSTKHLLHNHKELELVKILDGPRNREFFNQGQVVFRFRR